MASLKAGDGTKVADGDYVVLKYTASDLGRRHRRRLHLEGRPRGRRELVKSDTVPEGMVKGLVGKRSRFPGADRCAAEAERRQLTAAPTDATLVYVVDILGIIPHTK